VTQVHSRVIVGSVTAPIFLVAITRLGTAIETEAKALASQLGGLAYEYRLKLNAGEPAIVLATPDGVVARLCVEKLRMRGHEAMVVAANDVIRADAMLALKRFHFESDALVSSDGLGARLPWGDITALVRATHRTVTESSEVVQEKKFSPMRAALSGGLVINTTTTTKLKTHTSENEAVLYIFAAGTAPWLLRERHARYDALGSAVTLQSLENFRLTVAEIRKHAPRAPFDERLVTRKTSPEEDDILAHIIVTALRAAAGS
jgi:hypothetical protein